ncbi:acyltransferase family protein [Oleiharenicola lentus]|uniref:acyltransferase family protein n=1 Tax=Oleiharenicola lentus TaxID=2508720 RepID=UPI003F67330B
MSPAPNVVSRRYESLDQWRGFAAGWVLVFHAINVWLIEKPDLLPAAVAWFCQQGWLGAHIFFVVSGYCIAERTAREYRQRGSTSLFLADRFMRIFPPYWAALVLAAALALLAAATQGVSPSHELPQGAAGWGQSITATEHWFGRPEFLLVVWTLSLEVGFYLLAGACLQLSLFTRSAWTGWALAIGLILLGLAPAVNRYSSLLQFWPHFSLGGIVWLISQARWPVSVRIPVGTGILWGIAILAGGLNYQAMHIFYFVLGCAWLLLVLKPFDATLAATPLLAWLGWLGTFSYSLYLVHAPVVGKLRNLASRSWPASRPGSLWVILVACAVAVVVAWYFFKLVEQRSERWRKALIGKLGARLISSP